MDEFWVNIAAPGESTGWHDHKERSELSGVYYLYVPDNSGDIHFRKNIDDKNFDWKMKSQTAKLILFDYSFLEWLTDQDNKVSDFSNEVIPKLIGRIQTWHTKAPYIDIGTPNALKKAQFIFQ